MRHRTLSMMLVAVLAFTLPAMAQLAGWQVKQGDEVTNVPETSVTLQAKAGSITAAGPAVPVKAGANLALAFKYSAEYLIGRNGTSADYTELTVMVTWYNEAGKDVDEKLLSMGNPPVKRVWVLTKNSATPLEVADNLIAPSNAKTAQVSFMLQLVGDVHPANVQVSDVTLSEGQIATKGIDLPVSGPADAGPLSTQPAGFKFGENLVPNGALEEGDILPTGWKIIGDNSLGAAEWVQGGAYSGKRCLKITDRGPYVRSWEKNDLDVSGGEPAIFTRSGREEVSARFISPAMPVVPGAVYQASSMLWYLNRPGSEQAQVHPVRIQFLDEAGKVIPLVTLWEDGFMDQDPFTRPGWVLTLSRQRRAPANAKFVRLVIVLNHALYSKINGPLTKLPENRGFVLVDNIALYQVHTNRELNFDNPSGNYGAFFDTAKAGAMPFVPTSPAHRPNSVKVESLTDGPCGIIVGTPSAGMVKDLKVHVINYIGDVRPLEVQYDIVDWQEKVLYQGVVKTTANPFSETILPIDRPAKLPYGPYTLRFSVLDSGQPSDTGESRFAIIRRNGATFAEKGRMDYPFASWAWYFGTAVANGVDEDVKELGGMLQAAGVGKQNFCAGFYLGSLINIADPQARAKATMAQIALARKINDALEQYGMHSMGLMGTDTKPVPPEKYHLLTEVVTQIVTTMKDQQHIWTFGDEQVHGGITDLDTATNPDGSNVLNWGREGTLRQYWNEYAACYHAAKTADPTCLFGPEPACDTSGNVVRLFFKALPDKPIDCLSINMFASTFSIWPSAIQELKKAGKGDIPLYGGNFYSYQEAPQVGPGRYREEAEAVHRMTTYWVESMNAFPQLIYIPQWGTTLDDDNGSFTYRRRVRPQFVTYANMTDCLGAGKFIAKYEIPAGVVFVRQRSVRPGIVGVMWSTASEAVAELEVGAPSVEIRDVWGNARIVKTDDGIVRIPLTPMPQYLLGAKVIKPAPSVKMTVTNSSLDPRNPLVTVTIINEHKVPLQGTLILLPESAIAVTPGSMTVTPIPAGGTRTCTFHAAPVDPDLDKMLSLRARFVTKARTYEAVGELNFHYALRVTTPPTIDGDLTEWSTACPFIGDREEQIFKYQNQAPWGGPEEFSGRLWMRWDSQNLYLAARVKDLGFTPAKSPDMLWAGDAIEMLFDLSGSLSKSGKFTQIALGTLVDGKPAIYRFDSPLPQGLLTTTRLVVKRLEHETLYEAAIPWKELGTNFTPKAGTTISTCFGFNDADAGIRMISWFHKVSGKDLTTFGRVRLVDSPAGAGSASVQPKNLLVNGDFEDPAQALDQPLKGWSFWYAKDKQEQPTAKAYLMLAGAFQGRSLCIERLSSEGIMSTGGWRIPVKPGEIYCARMLARSTQNGIAMEITPLNAQGQGMEAMAWIKPITPATRVVYHRMIELLSGEVANKDAFAPAAGVFEIPKNAAWININFMYNWSSGKALVDNVELYRLR